MASEEEVSFRKVGGHSHDGEDSTKIDFSKYTREEIDAVKSNLGIASPDTSFLSPPNFPNGYTVGTGTQVTSVTSNTIPAPTTPVGGAAGHVKIDQYTDVQINTVTIGATISWVAPTGLNSDQVIGYEVELVKDGVGTIRVETTAAQSILFTGLEPTTGYSVRVRAMDRLGRFSAYLPSAGYTSFTSTVDQTVPAQVTGVQFFAGLRTVTVTWTDNTDDDVEGGRGTYHIQLASDSGFSNILKDKINSGTVTSFTDLSTNTTYYVRVKAVDSSGNESTSWSSTASGTTGYLVNSDIQAGTINADRLVANSITAGQIQAATITGTQIQSNSIQADKLATGTLDASTITIGSTGILRAGQTGSPFNYLLLDANGLRFYKNGSSAFTGGTNTVNLAISTGNAFFSGSISASDITGSTIEVGTDTNMLSRINATFGNLVATTSDISWVADANIGGLSIEVTLDRPLFHGVSELAIYSAAAGNMSVRTPTGTSGIAVSPNTQYTAMVHYRDAGTVRQVRTDIKWYTAAGALISTSTGTAVTQTSSQYTMARVVATSPGTAAYAAIFANVLSTALLEVHLLDGAGFYPGDVSTWTITDSTAKLDSAGIYIGGETPSTSVLIAGTDGILKLTEPGFDFRQEFHPGITLWYPSQAAGSAYPGYIKFGHTGTGAGISHILELKSSSHDNGIPSSITLSSRSDDSTLIDTIELNTSIIDIGTADIYGTFGVEITTPSTLNTSDGSNFDIAKFSTKVSSNNDVVSLRVKAYRRGTGTTGTTGAILLERWVNSTPTSIISFENAGVSMGTTYMGDNQLYFRSIGTTSSGIVYGADGSIAGPHLYGSGGVSIGRNGIVNARFYDEGLYLLEGWFRTTGDRGLYNNNMGNGVYFPDGDTVKTYGSAKFIATFDDSQDSWDDAALRAETTGNFNVGVSWHAPGARAHRLTVGTDGIMYGRNSSGGIITVDIIATNVSLTEKKENIRYIDKNENILEKIKLAKPARYKYKKDLESLSKFKKEKSEGKWDDAADPDTPEPDRLGFMVEELVEIFPEACVENEQGELHGIAYQWLTVPLFAAVQRLVEKIESLEERISRLEE